MHRVLCLSIALGALIAQARIIHVPGDYDTIQQGIDAAESGDIVLVAPGRYVEEITLKTGVIVRGAGEGRSIIDGGGNPGDVVRAIGNAITNDTKLQGFTITGAANSGGMPGGGGLFCNSGAAPDVSNCRIEGNDTGVACWNGSEAYIHNNVIVNNVYNGFSTGAGATLINNTIHDNRIGVYDYSGYRPVVMNNIITGNSSYGIYGPSSGNGPQISWNDVWGNGEDYRNCSPGTGDISADPLYADTANGDYTLGTGSPCIDSGNPDPQYNDPDGSRNDMGAYGGPAAASNTPQVVSISPARNALNVPEDVEMSAGFNLDIDPSTLTGGTFLASGRWSGIHPGDIEYDSVARVVLLAPDDPFQPGEPVTAWLTNGIRTALGDTFAGFSWRFCIEVGDGSGQYADPVAYSPQTGPTGILTGDFNQDEQLDLVTCNLTPGSISFFAGNGDGTFAEPVNTSSVGAAFCGSAGDFNADGVLDLAVTRMHANLLGVLLGNGDGTFRTPVDYPTGGDTRQACCADFDLDGDLDLAAAIGTLDSAAVLLNNGDGSFAPAVRYPACDWPEGIACADMDNDGVPDLVVGSTDADTVAVLIGQGDGTFLPGPAHGAYAECVGPVLVGDLDEDGNADIVVVEEGGARVLLGDGTGRLQRYARTGASEAEWAELGDLDGDGHLDLALVAVGTNVEISIHLGDGTGILQRAFRRDAGTNPVCVCLGDFDEDDDLDAATGNYPYAQVMVLLNEDQLYVTATDPDQHATAAPESTSVAATFNLDVLGGSLHANSFRVTASQSGTHPGAVSYDSSSRTGTLAPTQPFIPGEQVTTTLTRSVHTTRQVPLRGFVWQFTTAPPESSSGDLAGQTAWPCGNQPRGLWAADFDGDTDVDLALTNNTTISSGAVALLKNNGDGTFAAPLYTNVASDPISLFGGDLDADGDVDLACFHNQPGTSTLEVLRNDGSGGLSVVHTYTPAILGQHLSGCDFDADGDIDLVLSDGWGSQDNVRVLLNDGNGAYTGPTNYSAGSHARGAGVLDIENDGDIDLVVANSGNQNVSLLTNNGAARFDELANHGTATSPNRLHAADLDADGWVDLVASMSSNDRIQVLLNTGTGTLGAPVGYSTVVNTKSIAGGDLDGDGDIDLAFGASNADSAAVLLNNGDGTFGDPVLYKVGDNPWDVGIADFNGDGALDLACANYTDGTVSVLFATGLGIAGGQVRPGALALAVRPTVLTRSAQVRFSLPAPGRTALRVYDPAGRLVRTLVQGLLGAGVHSARLAGDLPAGVLFVRLDADAGTRTTRIVVAR